MTDARPLSHQPLLRVRNVTRLVGRIAALDRVSFELATGEVIGLVGRRGMGKTALVQLLAGLGPVHAGEVSFDGRPVRFSTPFDARRAGIEIVHEHPALADEFDVLENIFLGRERGWRERLRWNSLADRARRARALLAKLDLPPDLLQETARHLSDEHRQAVAILRAVSARPRLLIMDEALEALSFQRQERCLALLRELAAQGTGVILVSDNLKSIFAVTDRVLVLFEGRLVTDRRTHETSQREIVELIVGSTQSEQVTPVIWALESYHSASQQAEQLHLAQNLLQQSLDAQGSLNQLLVERMRKQVEALDQLNIALQATQRRLMTDRESERKRLARELHDGIIQDLLSFNYQLAELENSEPALERRKELGALRENIRQAVVELRQVCSDLRPPTIDSHGLPSAIRSYANEWADANDVDITLELEPALGRLPEAIELSVFRMVQEALTNVRRHAGARRVRVCLRRNEAERLVLRVEDDGQGFAEPVDLASLSANRHYGLLGISERAALLGGTMVVASQPNSGTALEVEIPTPAPLF